LWFTVRTPLFNPVLDDARKALNLNIPRALGCLQSLNSVTEIIVAKADVMISRIQSWQCPRLIALLDTLT
jgi:hypothetical protein